MSACLPQVILLDSKSMKSMQFKRLRALMLISYWTIRLAILEGSKRNDTMLTMAKVMTLHEKCNI